MISKDATHTSFWNVKIKNIHIQKFTQIVAILFLVAAIPFTVYIAQKQQETRSRAFSGGLNVSVSPNSNILPGQNVTVDLTGGCGCGAYIGISTGGLSCPNSTATLVVDPGCKTVDSPGTFDWRWNCTAGGPGTYSISGVGGNGGSCGASSQYVITQPVPTPPPPTSTPIPTGTPMPTPTPTPGLLSTLIDFSVSLAGIGSGGVNQSPKTPIRNATVCLYPLTTDPTGDSNCAKSGAIKANGTIRYDPVAKNFTNASFDIGNVASGQYAILVKVDNFLRKRIGTVATIVTGKTNSVGTVTLLSGDINNSNVIDVTDYNHLLACYGNKLATCQFKPSDNSTQADLNDDGVIDGVDYNLFIRSLAVQLGD